MLLCLTAPTLPSSRAFAGEISAAEYLEVITLQKEQIDDYARLTTTQEEQIRRLNLSVNECRDDLQSKIDQSAAGIKWDSFGAITGYLVGLVGIVFGATIYAVKR